MPISQLDTVTALVVVDLQSGTMSNPTVHPIGEIVATSGRLAAAFRERGLPVVLATADGTPAGRNDYGRPGGPWPESMTVVSPDLRARADDLTVTRSGWSVFGSDLHERLRALGVTQVVLVGVATSFGVESSARAAYDLGYSVTIVIDAITDVRPESHENSVSRVFPALGETGTVADVLELLAAR